MNTEIELERIGGSRFLEKQTGYIFEFDAKEFVSNTEVRTYISAPEAGPMFAQIIVAGPAGVGPSDHVPERRFTTSEHEILASFSQMSSKPLSVGNKFFQSHSRDWMKTNIPFFVRGLEAMLSKKFHCKATIELTDGR